MCTITVMIAKNSVLPIDRRVVESFANAAKFANPAKTGELKRSQLKNESAMVATSGIATKSR